MDDTPDNPVESLLVEQLQQLSIEHTDTLNSIPKLIHHARLPLLAENDRLVELLERVYRLAVGHGPDFSAFDSWEEAIQAYEEQRHETPDVSRPNDELDEEQALAIAVEETRVVRQQRRSARSETPDAADELRRALRLVEDLRYAVEADTDPWDVTLYTRAADEIERLVAESRSKSLELLIAHSELLGLYDLPARFEDG